MKKLFLLCICIPLYAADNSALQILNKQYEQVIRKKISYIRDLSNLEKQASSIRSLIQFAQTMKNTAQDNNQKALFVQQISNLEMENNFLITKIIWVIDNLKVIKQLERNIDESIQLIRNI